MLAVFDRFGSLSSPGGRLRRVVFAYFTGSSVQPRDFSSRLFVVPLCPRGVRGAACRSPDSEMEIGKGKGGNQLSPIVWILLIAAAAACGVLGGFAYRKNIVEKKIGRTEEMAKRLYDDAVKKAEDYKKEKVLEAKEEILKAKAESDRERAESEKEMRERRNEVQRSERHLDQREETLDKREDTLNRKSASLEAREDNLNEKIADLARQKAELDELKDKQITELERIAAMTRDEAKQIIVDKVQKEAYHDAAAMVRDIETQAKEEGEKKARNIVALAIQKCAADHVAETTVSVINLPNDDMKGRIIGREGRNIRALETATGVDLIIDDTPEAVIVSAFDPVRREVARLAV